MPKSHQQKRNAAVSRDRTRRSPQAVIVVPYLRQNEAAEDHNDQRGDEEDEYGSSPNPGWALVGQGAGGEVSDTVVVPRGEKGNRVTGTCNPATGYGNVSCLH